MSEKETGGPAFPYTVLGDLGQTREVCEGMTLRDYFAGQALAGFMASKPSPTHFEPEANAGYVYAIADAMLKERAK